MATDMLAPIPPCKKRKIFPEKEVKDKWLWDNYVVLNRVAVWNNTAYDTTQNVRSKSVTFRSEN
jgi:hypothetical protein